MLQLTYTARTHPPTQKQVGDFCHTAGEPIKEARTAMY